MSSAVPIMGQYRDSVAYILVESGTLNTHQISQARLYSSWFVVAIQQPPFNRALRLSQLRYAPPDCHPKFSLLQDLPREKRIKAIDLDLHESIFSAIQM